MVNNKEKREVLSDEVDYEYSDNDEEEENNEEEEESNEEEEESNEGEDNEEEEESNETVFYSWYLFTANGNFRSTHENMIKPKINPKNVYKQLYNIYTNVYSDMPNSAFVVTMTDNNNNTEVIKAIGFADVANKVANMYYNTDEEDEERKVKMAEKDMSKHNWNCIEAYSKVLHMLVDKEQMSKDIVDEFISTDLDSYWLSDEYSVNDYFDWLKENNEGESMQEEEEEDDEDDEDEEDEEEDEEDEENKEKQKKAKNDEKQKKAKNDEEEMLRKMDDFNKSTFTWYIITYNDDIKNINVKNSDYRPTTKYHVMFDAKLKIDDEKLKNTFDFVVTEKIKNNVEKIIVIGAVRPKTKLYWAFGKPSAVTNHSLDKYSSILKTLCDNNNISIQSAKNFTSDVYNQYNKDQTTFQRKSNIEKVFLWTGTTLLTEKDKTEDTAYVWYMKHGKVIKAVKGDVPASKNNFDGLKMQLATLFFKGRLNKLGDEMQFVVFFDQRERDGNDVRVVKLVGQIEESVASVWYVGEPNRMTESLFNKYCSLIGEINYKKTGADLFTSSLHSLPISKGTIDQFTSDAEIITFTESTKTKEEIIADALQALTADKPKKKRASTGVSKAKGLNENPSSEKEKEKEDPRKNELLKNSHLHYSKYHVLYLSPVSELTKNNSEDGKNEIVTKLDMIETEDTNPPEDISEEVQALAKKMIKEENNRNEEQQKDDWKTKYGDGKRKKGVKRPREAVPIEKLSKFIFLLYSNYTRTITKIGWYNSNDEPDKSIRYFDMEEMKESDGHHDIRDILRYLTRLMARSSVSTRIKLAAPSFLNDLYKKIDGNMKQQSINIKNLIKTEFKLPILTFLGVLWFKIHYKNKDPEYKSQLIFFNLPEKNKMTEKSEMRGLQGVKLAKLQDRLLQYLPANIASFILAGCNYIALPFETFENNDNQLVIQPAAKKVMIEVTATEEEVLLYKTVGDFESLQTTTDVNTINEVKKAQTEDVMKKSFTPYHKIMETNKTFYALYRSALNLEDLNNHVKTTKSSKRGNGNSQRKSNLPAKKSRTYTITKVNTYRMSYETFGNLVKIVKQANECEKTVEQLKANDKKENTISTDEITDQRKECDKLRKARNEQFKLVASTKTNIKDWKLTEQNNTWENINKEFKNRNINTAENTSPDTIGIHVLWGTIDGIDGEKIVRINTIIGNEITKEFEDHIVKYIGNGDANAKNMIEQLTPITKYMAGYFNQRQKQMAGNSERTHAVKTAKESRVDDFIIRAVFFDKDDNPCGHVIKQIRAANPKDAADLLTASIRDLFVERAVGFVVRCSAANSTSMDNDDVTITARFRVKKFNKLTVKKQQELANKWIPKEKKYSPPDSKCLSSIFGELKEDEDDQPILNIRRVKNSQKKEVVNNGKRVTRSSGKK